MGISSRSKRKGSPISRSSPSASRPKAGPELFARDSEDDLKLAVDFGATFTIVAVCKPKEAGSRGRPEFHVIRDYPFDPTPNPDNSAPQILAGLMATIVYAAADAAGSRVPTAWVLAFGGCAAVYAPRLAVDLI